VKQPDDQKMRRETQHPEVIERTSPSPLEAVYATEEFKREWAKELGQTAPSESEEK